MKAYLGFVLIMISAFVLKIVLQKDDEDQSPLDALLTILFLGIACFGCWLFFVGLGWANLG